MNIIKRNGDVVEFDKTKIENAILKAMKYGSGIVYEDIAKDIADLIEDHYKIREGKKQATVYDVEDMVYEKLIQFRQELTAKAYEGYRAVQAYKRENHPLDESILGLMNYTNEDVILENSNKQSKLASTQRDLIAGEVSKYVAKTRMIPPHIVQAHEEGIIKIHDLDYFAQPITNCFDGDTKIITDKGTFSFKELGEGTQIKVPTHTGEWKNAIVKTYGKQDLYSMIFTRQNGMTKEVLCTANHRWILRDGTVTTDLKVGDKLQVTPIIENFNIKNMTDEEKLAWIQGFIIGDGREIYNNDNNYGCDVRLCGEKNKYLSIFTDLGFHYWKIKDHPTDVNVYIPKMKKYEFILKKEYLKLNYRCKVALINGLFCADGTKDKNEYTKYITTINEDIANMVRKLCETAGYYLNNEFVVEGTTNFAPNGRKPLTYIQYNRKQYDKISWKLVSKEFIKNDLAWCLEVEDNHSFILSNGMVTGNCELVPLDEMFKNGTVINKKLIETPKSLRTASTLATQIAAQISSFTYGGQTMSLSHLAPYVRVSKNKIRKKLEEEMNDINIHLSDEELEKITIKRLKDEIKDSVQTFNYQLSTLNSTNGQSPFLSLVMYISEDPEYEEETAMLIEEFLKQRIEGMKNEYGIISTPTFPKLLFFLDENNMYPDSKYYYLKQLAIKATAKRMNPDYISVKRMKELYGYAFPCMGCRSFLAPYYNEDGKVQFYGRGNLGVVTLNLPHVALSAKGNEEEFWKILDERLELCKEALMLRYDKLKGVKAEVAPLLWQYGVFSRLNPEDEILPVLKKFTISLGYIGLYETTKCITGVGHTEEKGFKFAYKLMKYLQDTVLKWKKETGLGFALYGTPSESTAGYLSDKLKATFGEIKDITDKGFLTNSYHVDVRQDIDAFSKLDLEGILQTQSLGGNVSYVEVNNLENNLEALEQLVDFMYKHNIYAEVNTESDVCGNCHYSGKMDNDSETLDWVCPVCGNRDQNKLSVIRRVCGYLGETHWTKGRKLDILNRVKHL